MLITFQCVSEYILWIASNKVIWNIPPNMHDDDIYVDNREKPKLFN